MIAVQKARGGELAHCPLDGVPLGEVPRFAGDVSEQLLEGDLQWMEGQYLAQHGRLDGRVLLGWVSNVVRPVHRFTYVKEAAFRSLPLKGRSEVDSQELSRNSDSAQSAVTDER